MAPQVILYMDDEEAQNFANALKQETESEDNTAQWARELKAQKGRDVERLESREYDPIPQEETQHDVNIEQVAHRVKEEDAIEGQEKGGKGKSQRWERMTYDGQVVWPFGDMEKEMRGS